MVKNLMPVQEAQEMRGFEGSISGWGISPGEGNGNSFQYSCQENPMDRGDWWATVPGATKSQLQLSTHMHTKLHHVWGHVRLFLQTSIDTVTCRNEHINSEELQVPF